MDRSPTRHLLPLVPLVSALMLSSSACSAANRPFFEFQLGWSYNQPEQLSIELDDGSSIAFDTSWRTEAFTLPVYYSVRTGLDNGKARLEFELIHNKLIAEQPTEQISHFEISHGYNLLLVNAAFPLMWSDTLPGRIRLGGGSVLAHPDITVNGVHTHEEGGLWPELLGSGYQLTGYALQLAGEGRKSWGPHSLLAEAKLIHASSMVELKNGQVRVPNSSLHLTAGYGFSF